MDNELLRSRFAVESKLFFLDFKQNPNGRYRKITDRSGGRRRSFVIVPEGRFDSFVKELSEILRDSTKI